MVSPQRVYPFDLLHKWEKFDFYSFFWVPDISDHLPVSAPFQILQNPQRLVSQDKPRFCFSPVELDRLKEDLGTYKSDFSLSENISLGNYNDIFGRFYDTVKEKFTSYCLKAPLKNPRSKRSTPVAPWLISGVLKSIKRKQNLWKEYKKDQIWLSKKHLSCTVIF